MPTNKQLHTLAHIVLPNGAPSESPDLYVRMDCNKWHFNTWMNCFAAKKHYEYCALGHTYLNIRAKGIYRLEIIGSRTPSNGPREDVAIFSQEIKDNACINIPDARAYDGLYFSLITDPEQSFEFISGSWCTDTPPPRQNKLAIITCTYKRDEQGSLLQ